MINNLLKYFQKEIVLSPFTIEIYKVSNRLSPPVVNNMLTQKNSHPYNLRLNSQFSRPFVRSVFHGTESIFYLGPVIWDILPDSYQNLPNFSVYKKRIRKWKAENCPCRLYKTCSSKVGFTQAFAPLSWMNLWHFSHSCLYKSELVFKFLTFMFIIKFIVLQFLLQAVDVNQHVCIVNFIRSQFVIFKPLSFCFKETMGFDIKASFASRPQSRLIR